MNETFDTRSGLILVEAAVDGLLGLDVFRGQSLTIDLRAWRISLA